MPLEIAQTIISFVGGGAAAAALTSYLEARRAKTELAITMTYDFSSAEAHKLRELFWSLPLAELQTFEQVDKACTEQQRTAFRFVLGYFVQAAGLMHQRQINKDLFFQLSQRWTREILDRHLIRLAEGDQSDHYVVQRTAIKNIHGSWLRWGRRTRLYRD